MGLKMNKNFEYEYKQCLLNMMSWLHSFCLKNNLRYYALGGTMLGAARHKGFIPWDDDIDIGVPRKDYERLACLLKRTNGRYRIETPRSQAKDFIYTYSKLYDTETTLIENSKIPIKRGVFIDIFPLDGLGDSLEESRRIYRRIDRKRMLLVSRVTSVRSGRSAAKNALALLSQSIPNFIIDNKKLQSQIDNMCRERDFDKCSFGGNLLGHWRFKEVMESRIMGKPTLYPFETMEIYGAEHYEEYLTHLYGDWRQLPPEDKRVTIHDFKCNLHRSYLKDKEGNHNG